LKKVFYAIFFSLNTSDTTQRAADAALDTPTATTAAASSANFSNAADDEVAEARKRQKTFHVANDLS
jgi:hypothetical protein